MVDNNGEPVEIPSWWWTYLGGVPLTELEAEAALEAEVEAAIKEITTSQAARVGELSAEGLNIINEWTEEELTYLKGRALEVFVTIRDNLMADGYTLEDAIRLSLEDTRELMAGEVFASRVSYRDALDQALNAVDKQGGDTKDDNQSLVDRIKDWIGGVFGDIAKALAIAFEWLAERLEDLLRIPSAYFLELLADIIP